MNLYLYNELICGSEAAVRPRRGGQNTRIRNGFKLPKLTTDGQGRSSSSSGSQKATNADEDRKQTKAYLIDLNEQSFENSYFPLLNSPNRSYRHQQLVTSGGGAGGNTNKRSSVKVATESSFGNEKLQLSGGIEGSRIFFKDCTNSTVSRYSFASTSSPRRWQAAGCNSSSNEQLVLGNSQEPGLTQYRLKALDNVSMKKVKYQRIAKSIEVAESSPLPPPPQPTTIPAPIVTVNKVKYKSMPPLIVHKPIESTLKGDLASTQASKSSPSNACVLFSSSSLIYKDLDDVELNDRLLEEELKYRAESPYKLDKCQPDNYKYVSSSTMNINNYNNSNHNNSRLFEANNQQFELYQSVIYDQIAANNSSS
jgi:hypothetical protein